MAEQSHGISSKKEKTSISTPKVAETSIPFFVGTAPVQMVDGKVNEVLLFNKHEEAVAAMGYSDEWKKYGLCEAIYTEFSLYGNAPVVMVNVLDPSKHKKDIEQKEYDVIEKQIKLPVEAIKNTIKVTGKQAGTDYGVFYSNGSCVIEFLDDTTGKINVEYSEVDPTQVTKADIIGGIDVTDHKATGLELIDRVFPKYTVAPDLIMCPNWSQNSEVAAVMEAKGENINGVFEADAIIDIDTEAESGVTYYSDAPSWKKQKNLTKANELVCFPRLGLDDKTFNYSTQLAALMQSVDNDEDYGDGTPSESASNKPLQADRMVLADGSEVLLDLQEANHLNDNGIITALNFYNGFVSWGNYTAAFPASNDPVDYFYCISRMFKWVAKTVTLSYWSSIDGKMTRRLIDAILQGVNDWLNGLTTDETILGGRVEFREDENTQTALMAGKGKFHIFLTPPSPFQQMEFVLEYDISYLSASLLAA